jgi:hypothetical protein
LDADRRLSAFIAERVESTAAGTARRRWFEMPAFRLVAAAAAVAIVVVAAFQFGPDSRDPVLRGADRVELTTHAPHVAPDGAVVLSWSPIDGANAYQVVLLREDLSEVSRPAVTRDPQIEVDARASDGATHWQVVALKDDAVVAESAPRPLRGP